VAKQSDNSMDQEFLEMLKNKPFDSNQGGLSIHGQFALWTILKHINPTAIIESGVWKGASTWLIEQTCPKSTLTCIDPLFSKNRDNWYYYLSPRAKYQSLDFCADNFEYIRDKKSCLVIFDDHQDVLPRLEHAQRLGFSKILLDDNYKSLAGSHNTLYCYQHLIKDEALSSKFNKIKIAKERFLNDLFEPRNFQIYTDESLNKAISRNMTYIELGTDV